MAEERRRFGGLFARIARGDVGEPGAAPAPVPAPIAQQGEDTGIRLRFADPADEARRRVLVLLLGVPSADLGRLLDLSARALDPRRDLAVFVVTTLDFAPLRDRGAVFEYLPALADLGGGPREPYDTYVRRRLAIVRLKWDAAAEIDFGLPLEDALGGAAEPPASG